MARRRILVLLALIVVCGVSRAQATPGDPDPVHITVQSPYLSLEGYTVDPLPPFNVGCATGARCPDPCGDGRCASFTITVRDFANQPVEHARVWIDFANCSDVALACDQLTAETGQSFVAPKSVQGYSDADGTIVFRVQGRAIAPLTPSPNALAAGPDAGVACAQIWVDHPVFGGAIPVATEVVSAFDMATAGAGTAAVSAVDANFLMSEVLRVGLGATPRARDDLSHNGSVNSTDVALIFRLALDASLGSGSYCSGSLCP